MMDKKYAPYTYQDEALLRPSGSPERLEFIAGNCERLADFLKNQVDDDHHNQSSWTNHSEHECSTVGCALGWAVMSGKFPGLQYAVNPLGTHVPVMNGRVATWSQVAIPFFGLGALSCVFRLLYSSRIQTVKNLRQLAQIHRDGGPA